MKVASFLPSFGMFFCWCLSPSRSPLDQMNKRIRFFDLCNIPAIPSPKPHALRCRFEAKFRPLSPLMGFLVLTHHYIHQCPESGEIAMSHKNENLAATEEVFLDAFPLWCTQIHICFQPFPAPAPLWSSAGWGSDTGNDACRNLLGRIFGRFHHFNRWIWITSKVTSPLHVWLNIQVLLSLQMIHTSYTSTNHLDLSYTCVYILESWTYAIIPSHLTCQSQSTTAFQLTRVWGVTGPGFLGLLKISATLQSFPFDLQSDKQHSVAPTCHYIYWMSVDPNLEFQRYKGSVTTTNWFEWLLVQAKTPSQGIIETWHR